MSQVIGIDVDDISSFLVDVITRCSRKFEPLIATRTPIIVAINPTHFEEEYLTPVFALHDDALLNLRSRPMVSMVSSAP